MKRPRSYPSVMRRWYRPMEYECPECHRPLRQAMTLSKRTVITLEEVIKLIHAGYRCPDTQCVGHQRTYRSVVADALALPGFTFGVDIVLLVGRLHLGQHQTVDEVHQELLRRLEPLGVRISRREILYLFEAYCTLLRASSEAKEDQQWLAQVEKNGGIIVSVDGIQPEKGNETVYVVRDARTVCSSQPNAPAMAGTRSRRALKSRVWQRRRTTALAERRFALTSWRSLSLKARTKMGGLIDIPHLSLDDPT
jgi:hypothetical protein